MTLPSTPSFQLHDRRALVTGASSGIGLAAAVALGEAGAEVTLAARRTDILEEIVTEMQTNGMNARMAVVDISDIQATSQLIKEQAPFDVLVNSAGLARHTPATETTEADFDAVVDLNFKGHIFSSLWRLS